jgi:hypothetical protein
MPFPHPLYLFAKNRCASNYLANSSDGRHPHDANFDPCATFPKKVAQGSITLTRDPEIACVDRATRVPLFSRRGVSGTPVLAKNQIRKPAIRPCLAARRVAENFFLFYLFFLQETEAYSH